MSQDQFWTPKVREYLDQKLTVDGEQKRRERVCIAEIDLDVPASMKRLISARGIG